MPAQAFVRGVVVGLLQTAVVLAIVMAFLWIKHMIW